MEAYKQLIEYFAKGREVCNCGEAYLSNTGEAIINGERVYDYPICQHGCSSNQISAKREIGRKCIALLNIDDS